MARILVVDDSLSVRKALEKILNAHAEVQVAVSGEDALAQLSGDLPLPDLIISDVLMPGMSGPELARSLRALSHAAHIPVVLISGILDDDVQRQAQEVGAAVVRKPFGAGDLLPVVRHALYPDEVPLPLPQTAPAAAPELPYEPELDTGQGHGAPAFSQGEKISGAEPEDAGTRTAPAVTGDDRTQVAPAAAHLIAPDADTAQLPDVQPPAADLPDAQAVQHPTAAVAGADFGGLLQALMHKPGVMGALVSDAAGTTLGQAGEWPVQTADVGMYARFFLATSRVLGQRLGCGAGAGVQLDYHGAALLLLPLDRGHLLICLLADANSGSVVRFTLRRHLAASAAPV